jgi:hypothetical protein
MKKNNAASSLAAASALVACFHAMPAAACEEAGPIHVPVSSALDVFAGAYQTDAFHSILGETSSATTARISRTATDLNVELVSIEPRTSIKSDATRSSDIQQDDFVTVALIVGSSDTYLFSVNPRGIRSALSSVRGWGDTGWNADTVISADKWIARFDIPLSVLREPAPNRPVRISFIRQRQRPQAMEFYWPKTTCEQLSPGGSALILGLTI